MMKIYFANLHLYVKLVKDVRDLNMNVVARGVGGCQFRNIRNAIDYLLQEHKEPIKLKQWEYDLMWGLEEGSKFHDWGSLCYMKRKGYFKGVKDTSMSIQYILKNCEVIE